VKIALVVPDSVDLSDVYPARTLRKMGGQPPLGLLYVAAAAEAARHEVIIFDNYLDGASLEDLTERVLSVKPDCVGISATIMNIWQGFDLASLIKAEEPTVLTVFGGPQPTIDPFGTIQREGVDCVILGEGEQAFVELLQAYGRDARVPTGARGIVSKRPDGRVVEGPAPAAIPSLSGMARPARHLVNLSRYGRFACGLFIHPVDVIATSRGCSFRCAFCSSAEYWNRKYRTRPAAEVVDEMEYMTQAYGTRGFYFREDNFTLNRQHVLGICSEIQRRDLKVVWACESRVDTLPRETMARMVDAGCRYIWCGVESGSQRILDSICKGISVEQVRAFYRNAREIGVRTGASFMVGIPGETEQDVQRSVDLAKEIRADHLFFSCYVAYPGSPLYRHVCQDGLYSGGWATIRFVETEHLSGARVLELERELNMQLRWHRVIHRPIRSISSAIQSRLTAIRRLIAVD
jgi:anaerobic magnesium-protoporphyrin IX monomethyl ester cyclase